MLLSPTFSSVGQVGTRLLYAKIIQSQLHTSLRQKTKVSERQSVGVFVMRIVASQTQGEYCNRFTELELE